jgi:hypothetical protein
MTSGNEPEVDPDTGRAPFKPTAMDEVHAEEILAGRMPAAGMSHATAVIVSEFLAAHQGLETERELEAE